MLVPKYMSPTSLTLWEYDPEEYYLRYMAENRPAWTPQTRAMSVGSSFDAFVKSKLQEDLFGNGDFDKLFESQVELHNRDFAMTAGTAVMLAYVDSGAYRALRAELATAVSAPIFEVRVSRKIGGVPILGIPDLFFQNAAGIRVVYDWKVNGYCGKASPMKGYISLRRPFKGAGLKPHRGAQLMLWNGVMINIAMPLDEASPAWAKQLTTYSWLAGQAVGDVEWVAGVEQIVCRDSQTKMKECLVANHRSQVSLDFQNQLIVRYQRAWRVINSDWIFRDISQEDSIGRCELLEKRAAAGGALRGLI